MNWTDLKCKLLRIFDSLWCEHLLKGRTTFLLRWDSTMNEKRIINSHWLHLLPCAWRSMLVLARCQTSFYYYSIDSFVCFGLVLFCNEAQVCSSRLVELLTWITHQLFIFKHINPMLYLSYPVVIAHFRIKRKVLNAAKRYILCSIEMWNREWFGNNSGGATKATRK